MKVKINQPAQEFEAEIVFEKEVKPFGKTSGHIILPKKFIGYNVIVAIKEKTGQWLAGFRKKYSKEKKVESP